MMLIDFYQAPLHHCTRTAPHAAQRTPSVLLPPISLGPCRAAAPSVSLDKCTFIIDSKTATQVFPHTMLHIISSTHTFDLSKY
jgi:hypothetical protein